MTSEPSDYPTCGSCRKLHTMRNSMGAEARESDLFRRLLEHEAKCAPEPVGAR